MLHASHKPATFDLAGITPMQMDALRDGLMLLIEAKRMDADGLDWQTAEGFRLKHVAALDLIRATNGAIRESRGESSEED